MNSIDEFEWQIEWKFWNWKWCLRHLMSGKPNVIRYKFEVSINNISSILNMEVFTCLYLHHPPWSNFLCSIDLKMVSHLSCFPFAQWNEHVLPPVAQPSLPLLQLYTPFPAKNAWWTRHPTGWLNLAHASADYARSTLTLVPSAYPPPWSSFQ